MKQQVGRNIVEQQIGDCRHHVQDLQPARTMSSYCRNGVRSFAQFANGKLTLTDMHLNTCGNRHPVATINGFLVDKLMVANHTIEASE